MLITINCCIWRYRENTNNIEYEKLLLMGLTVCIITFFSFLLSLILSHSLRSGFYVMCVLLFSMVMVERAKWTVKISKIGKMNRPTLFATAVGHWTIYSFGMMKTRKIIMWKSKKQQCWMKKFNKYNNNRVRISRHYKKKKEKNCGFIFFLNSFFLNLITFNISIHKKSLPYVCLIFCSLQTHFPRNEEENKTKKS